MVRKVSQEQLTCEIDTLQRTMFFMHKIRAYESVHRNTIKFTLALINLFFVWFHARVVSQLSAHCLEIHFWSIRFLGWSILAQAVVEDLVKPMKSLFVALFRWARGLFMDNFCQGRHFHKSRSWLGKF